MAERHKWADVAIAFAEGKAIQRKICEGWHDWEYTDFPQFLVDTEWRVKPEPKPDVVIERGATMAGENMDGNPVLCWRGPANLRLIFDGETGALKSAEVIK